MRASKGTKDVVILSLALALLLIAAFVVGYGAMTAYRAGEYDRAAFWVLVAILMSIGGGRR